MSDSPVPILCSWNGDTFQPLDRHRGLADQQFTVGQVYLVEARMNRSKASHNHYFAHIKELWENLPESIAYQFPDPDHLRAFALIKCGFFTEKSLVLSTHADALRVASWIRADKPMDIVIVKERVIKRFSAKSQKEVAMDNKEFQIVKEAVFSFLEDLVGVTKQESSNGRTA